MTTDLSQYNANELPSADVLSRQRYAIVVADWNSEIVSKAFFAADLLPISR